METLYIDSNILLNVILGEPGTGEASLALLKMIESGKYSAVSSILAVMEIHRILQKHGKKEEQITQVIREIPSMGIDIAIPGEEEMISAYEHVKNLRINPADAIHLSTALTSAEIFVTRDAELGRKIRKLIKTVEPEELLKS